MKYEDIQRVNGEIEMVDIQKKPYATVNERVKAFRKLYPEGTIKTTIVSDNGQTVVMRAEIYNGDLLLADGIAQETKGSSFINKTSWYENCQTGAVGRALGMCGLGIDNGIASAEEVNGAKEQQEAIKKAEIENAPIDELKVQALTNRCLNENVSITKICELYHIDLLSDLNEKQHSNILNNWEKVKAACPLGE